MLINDDSIINDKERKEERDYKVKSEKSVIIIKDSDRGIENVVYINVRGSHCTATPTSIIANLTPPPPSQKHHFTQKHQINFCIDDIRRATSQR